MPPHIFVILFLLVSSGGGDVLNLHQFINTTPPLKHPSQQDQNPRGRKKYEHIIYPESVPTSLPEINTETQSGLDILNHLETSLRKIQHHSTIYLVNSRAGVEGNRYSKIVHNYGTTQLKGMHTLTLSRPESTPSPTNVISDGVDLKQETFSSELEDTSKSDTVLPRNCLDSQSNNINVTQDNPSQSFGKLPVFSKTLLCFKRFTTSSSSHLLIKGTNTVEQNKTTKSNFIPNMILGTSQVSIDSINLTNLGKHNVLEMKLKKSDVSEKRHNTDVTRSKSSHSVNINCNNKLDCNLILMKLNPQAVNKSNPFLWEEKKIKSRQNGFSILNTQTNFPEVNIRSSAKPNCKTDECLNDSENYVREKRDSNVTKTNEFQPGDSHFHAHQVRRGNSHKTKDMYRGVAGTKRVQSYHNNEMLVHKIYHKASSNYNRKSINPFAVLVKTADFTTRQSNISSLPLGEKKFLHIFKNEQNTRTHQYIKVGTTRIEDNNYPGVRETIESMKLKDNKGWQNIKAIMGVKERTTDEMPLVRRRSVKRSEAYHENKRKSQNYANCTKTFSRINTKILSATHNIYNPNEPAIKQTEGDDSQEVQVSIHRLQNDGKSKRRTTRSLGPHPTSYWMRTKALKKITTRGERSFSKTPQQRHARSRSRTKRKVSPREVWSLAGDTTLLPCDLTATLPKDSVQMVMWLREGTHTPLFSVDYREQGGGGPQVWRDNTASTAVRAHLLLTGSNVGMLDETMFTTDGRQQDYQDLRTGPHYEDHNDDWGEGEDKDGLIVRSVQRNDSAIYRCRVDFLLTPTRNTRVNLTVVVPPVSVSVRWWQDNSGNTEQHGEVGPFSEGDTPTLVCLTRYAWPAPRLVWFEEDMMVDDTYASDPGDEAVENTMVLTPLTRDYQHRRFTCLATNSNLTRPVAQTVHINMALDVLVVEIEEVGVLSAGVEAEIKCTVWGSNPVPTITWSLAGTPVPSSKPWVSKDGNRSVSLVQVTPGPTQDGTQLECSAHNPALTKGALQHNPSPTHQHHHTTINVNYAPQVSVSLGRSLDANNIKEGDDLYFECYVIAKPPPHQVVWKHNGEVLWSSPGVLVSNMTLVLQKVDRFNAGTYTCHANNQEGEAASPPLKLNIKYAPVCASDKPSQHSVAKHENARISCNVLANPPVVEFSWSFNNTAEAVKVPEDRYVMKGTESVVNYTPVTELDYGTLLCWANNDIGSQINPCVFQIVAAGKPDPPHNCRAYDVTISSLQVTCLPGDDGGLGQTFVLEVLEINGDNKPAVVVSRGTPSFSVANLRPATAYRLLVMAKNIKGESRPAELSAYTVALYHPQHETPAEPTRGRESGSEVAVGVLVGSVLACLPVVIAVVVLGVRTGLRVRAARNNSPRHHHTDKAASEMEEGGTGRPLLSAQGTTGSGDSLLCESGTDITTITGGVTMATPHNNDNNQLAQEETTLLYPGGRIYSPNRSQNVVAKHQGVSSLRREPHQGEEKVDGGSELLEVTVPPPAAYNQGYQVAYPPGQPPCQPRGPQRMMPGYPVLPVSHMACAGYPTVTCSQVEQQTNLQCISSMPLSQSYNPQLDVACKVSRPSPLYATLPHSNVSESSSFSTLHRGKESSHESNMPTLYNSLMLHGSTQILKPESHQVLNTGSLRRGIRLSHGQEVLHIQDNIRSRSASLSTVNSKKESSV